MTDAVLAGVLVRTALLVTGVGTCVLFARRGSAAVRHGLWMCALLGALAVPALVAWTSPRWSLPLVLPERARAVAAPVVRALEPGADGASPTLRADRGRTAGESRIADEVDEGAGSGDPAGPQPVPLALAVWLIGSALLGLRTLRGVSTARRLVARARPVVDPRTRKLFRDAARALDLGRRVRLLESDETRVPLSWGLLHPVVILPRRWRRSSDAELRSALLHELGHVARRDAARLLLAAVARAVHWPNPTVWFAASRARCEAERACDDRVVLAGVAPERYAEHLIAVARRVRARPAGGLAPAMARPGDLETRLRSVLAPSRSRALPNPGGRVAGVILVAALCLGISLAEVDIALPRVASFASATAVEGPATYRWDDGERSYEVRVRGTVTPDPAGVSVAQMSPGGSLVVTEYRPDAEAPVLYMAKPGNGEGDVAVGWTGRPGRTHGEEAARRRWEEEVLPSVWREVMRGAPPASARRPISPELDPSTWTLGPVSRGLTGERGDFVRKAVELMRPVAPGVPDEVLAETALRLWTHLQVTVLWGASSSTRRGAVRVEGESRIAVRRAVGDRPLLDVATVAGPLPEVLPRVLESVLNDAGVGPVGEPPSSTEALARSGAELAAYWEIHMLTGSG